MQREAQLAILFADVSGSTQLYDTLGDVRARGIVSRCIEIMSEATHHHGGTLIKTIGDEVMTTFPDAGSAAEAAVEMQEGITGQMVVDGRPRAIRVGFHFGPTLLEDDDVYGDAVNLAARIVSQAKAGEILTTGDTASNLPEQWRSSCRQIDLTQVKGKRDEIAIHELVWQASDATLVRKPWTTRQRAGGGLTLTIGETRLELSEAHPSATIGRADQNDLVVRQPVISRLHARIEYRNGRIVLTDLSANGTYIEVEGGDTRLLHRDSQELSGSGKLGLGEAAAPDSPTSVQYQVW